MVINRVLTRSVGGLLSVLLAAIAAAQDVNPYPRAVITTNKLVEWTFQDGLSGWRAANDSSIKSANGIMHVESTGDDPYLIGPPVNVTGPVVAHFRLKTGIGGNGQVFWGTNAAVDFDEARSAHFPLFWDSEWHDYNVELATGETIRWLRLDPAEAPGLIDISSFAVLRLEKHPLEIQSVQTDGANIHVRLKNYVRRSLAFTMDGRPFTLDGGTTEEFSETVPGQGPFRTHDIVIESAGLPALHRAVSLVDVSTASDWVSVVSGDLTVRAAPDGSGARIELDGQLVGVLAPLVSIDGAAPKMKLIHQGRGMVWRGEGVSVNLSLHGDEISMNVASRRACEGPVLRVFGPLEQGLFPGLEYLAKGEHSSSTLDIETPGHVRFSPDPSKVPMPMMAFVTDRAMAAMSWHNMVLQPVFATPNFLDGPEGHRASLRGRKIECTILVRHPAPLEDAILWQARRAGLPPLPPAPRSRAAEFELCRAALSRPLLKTAEGWRHVASTNWASEPYADQASTFWRLTGQIPSLPTLVFGGSHIPDEAIYFLTGRARQWLDSRRAGARALIAEQKPDGSFRYDGPYRRGHFEDTASGYCAPRAAELLEVARLTGDTNALQAGLKALEFMKHFRTPRGAQTWECPLHTPDILAAAQLVHAYVRGYELTGRRDYLDRARAWAITGLPFVYQWSDEPVMSYATIAVYGATHWLSPNWMGLPVQWCGYVYAYSLTMLAPLDKTLDWKKIATGIDITAEEMQFPSGEFAGCEPDSFILAQQHRNGPAINPCALVSLRLALEGKVDNLALGVGGGHRVVAPFPVTVEGSQARVEAIRGVKYQVLVDGEKVVDVTSRGKDDIFLK
ncbi:MAG TPA: hypothetical protein VH619_11215 [Verrucomicrobiae bacterium]|nr:hypothetical protein [Verrucomicrobiae bacterium]